MKTRSHLKNSLPPEKHLPGKKEAQLLRRLMSETGMNEEEIRGHYKYRVMLSNAKSTALTHEERRKKTLKRWVRYYTETLKLPHYHPLVKQKAEERCFCFYSTWILKL